MNNTELNTNKEKFKDNRDLATLLDYYRIKLDNFDKERTEWLEKLETLRQTLEEHHKLQWELQARNTEVLNLQINKTEITRAINVERQRVCQLTSELEFYKERSNQDRKRIVQLLQLTEPIEQQIKLFHNKVPEKTEKYNSHSMQTTSVDFKKVNYNPIDLNQSSNLYSTQSNTNKVTNVSSGPVSRSNIVNTMTSQGNKSMSRSVYKYGNNNTTNSSFNLNRRTINTNQITNTKDYITTDRNIMRSVSGKRLRSSSRGRQINKNTSQCKRTNNINNTSNSNLLESRIRLSTEKQHVLRSVVLPNYEKSDLHEEISFLKKQITDIRAFYEDIIHKQTLQEKDHDNELRLHIENEKGKHKELLESKQKAEEISMMMTKELINIKCDFAVSEKKMYEELDLVKLQNQALISAMKELSTRKELDKDNYISEQERKNNLVTMSMRTQLRNYQENVRIMKEQYKQIQNIFNNRMNEFIEKYNRQTERYKEYEDKLRKSDRSSSVSGRKKNIGSKNFDNMNLLVSEINNLNRKIKQIENMDFSKSNKSGTGCHSQANLINNGHNSNPLFISKSKSLAKLGQSGNTNRNTPSVSQLIIDNNNSELRNERSVNTVKSTLKERGNIRDSPSINNNVSNVNVVKDLDTQDEGNRSTNSKLKEEFKSLNPAEIKKKLKLNMNSTTSADGSKHSFKNQFSMKLSNKKEKVVGEIKKQMGEIENMFSNLKS